MRILILCSSSQQKTLTNFVHPLSPANAEAAQLYRENMKEYVRRVVATVEESWMDPDDMEEVERDERSEGGSSQA